MANNSIFSGQAGAGVSDFNKQYAARAEEDSRKMMRTTSIIPVSQLEDDIVMLSDGSKVKIHPKKIAQNTQFAITMMLDDPRYKFLKPYLNKPIIWTYEAQAAFTDGIRVFVNPYFANSMLKMGNKSAQTWQDEQRQKNPLFRATNNDINWKIAKLMLFVIVHECYHVLYQHIKRERLLLGNDLSKHRIANIAADLEINRDIESCFPQLAGSTETIQGVWWKNAEFSDGNNIVKMTKDDGQPFAHDVFEDILRYMIDHNIQPSDEAMSSPFNENNGANTNDKSATYYGSGWDVAVRGIQNKTIDPEDIDFI